MGQALLRGLLATGIPARRLRAADPRASVRRAVAKALRIAVSPDGRAMVRNTNVIVLAVKPQQMADAVAAIAPRVTRRQLVVSIAAGIPVRWFETRLRGIPVIRLMPNLAATRGQAYTAMACGRHATARHRRLAVALCEAVGTAVALPERHFDAITAISGSGPAYVFFLADAWQAAARRLGLPAAVAARAVLQTLHGSLALLAEGRTPAARLIHRVASKGGTTEAALRVLARRRVRAHLLEAIAAAARRSRELSW